MHHIYVYTYHIWYVPSCLQEVSERIVREQLQTETGMDMSSKENKKFIKKYVSCCSFGTSAIVELILVFFKCYTLCRSRVWGGRPSQRAIGPQNCKKYIYFFALRIYTILLSSGTAEVCTQKCMRKQANLFVCSTTRTLYLSASFH